MKLHGIFDLRPRVRGFATRLAEAKTACGAALPPRARRELERLAERLALVARQIAEVEAERDADVRRGEALPAPSACADEDARAAAKMATLVRLKGIGENDATLLTHEVFWRGFGNRRALASWAGIAPTPWASGAVRRDQGIGRDGPGWIRAQLVQMAWRWLRFQPDSALTRWYRERTAGGDRRTRRVMITALARKLLTAATPQTTTGLTLHSKNKLALMGSSPGLLRVRVGWGRPENSLIPSRRGSAVSRDAPQEGYPPRFHPTLPQPASPVLTAGVRRAPSP